MIVYGKNAKKIKEGKVRNIDCPHCTTNTTMNYSVFSSYAHIFWIPFFPYGRTTILECDSCKATYDLINLSDTIKEKLKKEQERNPAKTPLTQYSFVGVIAVVFAIVAYMGKKDSDNTKVFAKDPKVGDILYETTASGAFSTSKITRVTQDSVYILENNMEIERKSDVSGVADKEENYTMPYQLSRKQVLDFVKKGDTIYKIERK